jgi:prepilin-type N-terminal cleavage/methylation domain-containing protein
MMGEDRRVRSDERGVTLIELMVVVSILGTVLAIVTQGLIVAQTTLNENAGRLHGLSQTNQAMEAVTRLLRTAILPSQIQATCTGCETAAFIAGAARRVEFYANADNDGILPPSGMTDRGPRKVTFEINDAGELIEKVQKPNLHAVTDFDYQYCTPGPSCPVRTRVLARDVEDGVVFTYYNKANQTLSVPLDENGRKTVDSIDVVLRVQPSDRANSVTVTTRVTLPNADSLIVPTPTP